MKAAASAALAAAERNLGGALSQRAACGRALADAERLLKRPCAAESGGDLLLAEQERARLRAACRALEGELRRSDRSVDAAKRLLAETRQRSDAVADLYAEAMARLGRERARLSDAALADAVAVRAYRARTRPSGQASSDK